MFVCVHFFDWHLATHLLPTNLSEKPRWVPIYTARNPNGRRGHSVTVKSHAPNEFFLFGGQRGKCVLLLASVVTLWTLPVPCFSKPFLHTCLLIWMLMLELPISAEHLRHALLCSAIQRRFTDFSMCTDFHSANASRPCLCNLSLSLSLSRSLVMNDLWQFDIVASAWSEVRCTGDVPPPRAFHTAFSVQVSVSECE